MDGLGASQAVPPRQLRQAIEGAEGRNPSRTGLRSGVVCCTEIDQFSHWLSIAVIPDVAANSPGGGIDTMRASLVRNPF